MYTYDDAIEENMSITLEQVRRELDSHGICHPDDIAEGIKEARDGEGYSARNLLIWLGY